jgi:hypothetical protein
MRAIAAVIASGWVAHSWVELSTSASSSVTVPVGSSAMSTSLHSVALMLASIGPCAPGKHPPKGVEIG